jgi:SET family sugar efflux transporter-like MFS transporter
LVAAVAGIGMTLFQDMIPQPGLAVGIYANTRRIGAIASGAIIAFGSTSALGYRGVFVASGLVTALALLMLLVVRIRPSRSGHH